MITIENNILLTLEKTNDGLSISSSMPEDPVLILQILKILMEFECGLTKKLNTLAKDVISSISAPSDIMEKLHMTNDLIYINQVFSRMVYDNREGINPVDKQKIKDIKKILGGC